MRLFIAINFNDMTRARLIALRDELRDKAVYGRFSPSENLHLTLAFLGESDAKQTAAAKAVMDAVNFDPLIVTIGCIGRFSRGGSDIWWAGVSENKPLLNLYGDLTDKLSAAGFDLEKRKYSPHITLGREIMTEAVPRQIPAFGERVYKIDLMKSERVNGKLTYTAIHSRRCADS